MVSVNIEMPKSGSIDDVTRLLQGYADRGVFRAFEVHRRRNGSAEYRFVWLNDAAFTLRVNARSGVVHVVDLLQDIPFRSQMDQQLRAFVKGRSAEQLPDHRRIDPRLDEVKCTNRDSIVSVQLRLKNSTQLSLAVRKTINLINEIFHGFLSGPYHDYMVRHFNVLEE